MPFTSNLGGGAAWIQSQPPPGNLTIFVQVNRAVQPGGGCNRGYTMSENKPMVAITFTTPQEVIDALHADLAECRAQFATLADVISQHEATIQKLTDERDEVQGLLLATSAALDVMRETATIAARPAALIIKRLAECEGEKYAVTAERDMLQAWLKSAPLDAIVVISEMVNQMYAGSPVPNTLAAVSHGWASNKDMNRYVATLIRVVAEDN